MVQQRSTLNANNNLAEAQHQT